MTLKLEAIDPGEVAGCLDRLLKSDLLCRSSALSHLLEFLVAKALNGEGEHVKESVIAIELFHRGGNFDSKLDNIVRVHAHRLRRVLDAWYLGEGASDRLRFSIPKGSYTLHIEQRIEAIAEEAKPDLGAGIASLEMPGTVPSQPAPHDRKPSRFRVGRTTAMVALLGCACMGAAAMYSGLRLSGRLLPEAARRQSMPGGLAGLPLSALWKSVFRPGSNCIVSFTNPLFLRTNSPVSRAYVTYMGPLTAPVGTEFKVNPGDPFVDKQIATLGPLYFNESWTGIGEIMAVHKLTEMATQAGFHFKLVRGRALTYDDMKGSNAIFLGSPWANDMQSKFNIGMTPFRCFGTQDIVNNDPKNGEPPAWLPELNPTTKELIASYGLFSVLPGLSPGTKIVSSSGIDNYATLAAFDMMTAPDGVLELMRRFGTESQQALPDYFQAVIRTQIIRGDPAKASVVAVRALKPKD